MNSFTVVEFLSSRKKDLEDYSFFCNDGAFLTQNFGVLIYSSPAVWWGGWGGGAFRCHDYVHVKPC